MDKIIMLTKPNCPQCNSLKMYLKFALNNKYEDDITILDQVADADVFEEYVTKFDIVGLPAMVFNDEIIRETNPSAVSNFLEKHIGKK